MRSKCLEVFCFVFLILSVCQVLSCVIYLLIWLSLTPVIEQFGNELRLLDTGSPGAISDFSVPPETERTLERNSIPVNRAGMESRCDLVRGAGGGVIWSHYCKTDFCHRTYIQKIQTQFLLINVLLTFFCSYEFVSFVWTVPVLHGS